MRTIDMNSFAEVARGFGPGTAIAQPTAADKLSKEALDHSALAYELSKQANTSGKKEEHKQAARALRMAADSHEQAAKRYDSENSERAQEQRNLAKVRIEAAQRHEAAAAGHDIHVPVSQGGGSKGTDFLAEVKALAARENIGLDCAAGIVSAKRPDLFHEYRGKWHAPAMRRDPRSQRDAVIAQAQDVSISVSPNGDFATEARALAARENISLQDACAAVCRAKPGLYNQYRKQTYNYR
jgi:hypothetical protein